MECLQESIYGWLFIYTMRPYNKTILLARKSFPRKYDFANIWKSVKFTRQLGKKEWTLWCEEHRDQRGQPERVSCILTACGLCSHGPTPKSLFQLLCDYFIKVPAEIFLLRWSFLSVSIPQGNPHPKLSASDLKEETVDTGWLQTIQGLVGSALIFVLVFFFSNFIIY